MKRTTVSAALALNFNYGVKERSLVPKESHLALVDVHGSILKTELRILEASAQEEGIELEEGNMGKSSNVNKSS